MKISNINFQNTKTYFNQSKLSPIHTSKPSFDIVSFSAKPKQSNLTAEGKNIAKNSHGIYIQSQKIQSETQEFFNKSLKIQLQSQIILEEANQEWEEISSLLTDAKKNKTRAISDPFTKTDLFFDVNENKETTTFYEYKDDKLTRKVVQRPNITTITTYGDKTIRKIFDSETNTLTKYDYNINHYGSNSTSEHSYSFDNGSLKRYSCNKIQTHESTKAQFSYDFENGTLTKVALVPFLTNAGYHSSKEKYEFKNGALVRYSKSPQGEDGSYETSEEEYIFDDKKLTYTKNKNNIFDIILTADTIYQIDNSKIKKAIISLSQGQNTKTIDKLFTFDKHEKPQYCYLVYQAEVNEDDENFSYDNMVWLGGKKS